MNPISISPSKGDNRITQGQEKNIFSPQLGIRDFYCTTLLQSLLKYLPNIHLPLYGTNS